MLHDSAIVCRGGLCTADHFINGSGVSVDVKGMLQGVSVNSKDGKTIEELSKGIPNGKIGVTTVGDIRRAGGELIMSPNERNEFHATMSGISPEKAEELFTPVIKNPSKNRLLI